VGYPIDVFSSFFFLQSVGVSAHPPSRVGLVFEEDYVICIWKAIVAPWERDHSWISARSQHYDLMLELENRNNAQPRRPVAPREFFLPVEVYISNQAAAALRKVHVIYHLSICHLLLIHGTAKSTEEGREERLFETSLHAG
jgi:hypothetical protein